MTSAGFIRPTVTACLLFVLLGVAACAGHHAKVSRVAGEAPTGRLAVGAEGLAVGGVVPAAGLEPATPLGDEADHAALLHRLLQDALPGTPLMPQPVVQDMADPATLAAIRDEYARGEQVEAARLRRLGDELRGPRRLALARVERDELFFSAGNLRDLAERSPLAESSPHAGGHDAVRADAWATLAVGDPGKRKLTATLDLFDLTSGTRLWSMRATVDDDFRRLPVPPQDNTALRLAGGDSAAAPVRYERLPGGEVPSDGGAVLERCLLALVENLQATPGRERPGERRTSPDADPGVIR